MNDERENIIGMNAVDLERKKQFFDMLSKDDFISSKLREMQQKNINWDNAISNSIMKIFELEIQNVIDERRHHRAVEFETHKHNLKMAEKESVSKPELEEFMRKNNGYSPDDDY